MSESITVSVGSLNEPILLAEISVAYVTMLGIEAQKKREYFEALATLQVAHDPEARHQQIEQFERARAEMYATMHRHQTALGAIGKDVVMVTGAEGGKMIKALSVVRILAATPPEQWLSKKAIHAELQCFCQNAAASDPSPPNIDPSPEPLD